ncbi:MAG TPA: GatB/YqeY domain-containing protein [Candidatus Dojkabacteria bacterium]|nr:GatB/YqeY domain-containing protein [Candidatus Dojkabacteria bacterium]
MSLTDTLRKDMFQAIKDGAKDESEILKMALASIKNVQIESEEELTDKEIQKILRSEVKKIKDSIEQFKKMEREDLVSKEVSQLEVLQSYLPKPMSEDEVRKVVEAKVKELNAESMRDMGKVMGVVMKELEGKTDGNTVKDIVQDILS